MGPFFQASLRRARFTLAVALAATVWPLAHSGFVAAAAEPAARLSLNENPFGPSPAAIAAIRENLDGLARYTGDEAAALVEQISALERVPADQIVLGEILEPLGLQLALAGGPGGEFVYSVPGYTALVDAAQPAGGVVVAVALDAELRNDLAALRAAVNARTRALFLVNPHNPTGTVNEPAALRTFVREASRQTLVIVERRTSSTPRISRRAAWSISCAPAKTWSCFARSRRRMAWPRCRSATRSRRARSRNICGAPASASRGR